MSTDQSKTKPTYTGTNLPGAAVHQGTDHEERVNQALDHHQQRRWPPLFNSEEYKQVQAHRVAELSQGFEQRRQALSMILETRLHSIREACNHILVTGKTHLRQQRIEYFGEIFRQVEQRMSKLADEFLSDMDARMQKLEGYTSEVIRKREQQRLEKSVDDFLTTLDCLMDEFRSIIHENIEQGAQSEDAVSLQANSTEPPQPGDPMMDAFMLGSQVRP